MEIFIESVSITCEKCKDIIPFNVNILCNLYDKLSSKTLLKEVVDQNKDDPNDENVAALRDFGNCNQGYLNESKQTFTCKACLKKALDKKFTHNKNYINFQKFLETTETDYRNDQKLQKLIAETDCRNCPLCLSRNLRSFYEKLS